MQTSYIFKGKVFIDGENLNFSINAKSEISSDSEVRLAARGINLTIFLSKMLDAYLEMEQIDGYEFSVYKGNLTEEIIVCDKTLYHKSKGELVDEDSGE